jgi:membrane fusion protein (multidrug efflux system)
MPTNAELEIEIQQLREEQQRLKEAPPKPTEKESPEGGKGADQQTPEDKAKDEKAPAKPPASVRARNYARTHPGTILIGAVALVLLAIGTVFLLHYLDSYESTDDAEIDGHLNWIAPRVAGTITGVYVEDNQFVKAGQVLADLDQTDYQTSLAQARASASQAQAQLAAENPNVPIVQTTNQTTVTSSEADIRSAQASVASAQQDYDARLAAVRQAEVNHTKAELDRARYKLLVDKDEISKQQFDAVVAAERAGAAQVDADAASAEAARKVIDERRAKLAQAQVQLQEANQNAPRQVAIRKADIQARAAALGTARAQQEQARLNLSYTRILAPVSGIVVQKSAEIGQPLIPGQQLMAISQTDDIWVTANFKETQLRQMRPGQSVDVKVDAFGTKYHGYIESLPGATGAVTSLLPPENATGNYVKVVQRLPVRIRLKDGEDPEHRLRPGMSVEPTVWLDTGRQ